MSKVDMLPVPIIHTDLTSIITFCQKSSVYILVKYLTYALTSGFDWLKMYSAFEVSFTVEYVIRVINKT